MNKTRVIIVRDINSAINELERFAHPIVLFNQYLGLYFVMEGGEALQLTDKPPPATCGGRLGEEVQEPV